MGVLFVFGFGVQIFWTWNLFQKIIIFLAEKKEFNQDSKIEINDGLISGKKYAAYIPIKDESRILEGKEMNLWE